MTEEEALIQTMIIYSQTDKPVSQGFYQALCEKAVEKLKSQAEHIELLNQCDDSSTEVIGEMDEEIETLKQSCESHQIISRQRLDRIHNLETAIAAQKLTIINQGNANEEKHNILCGIKEEIDNYFGD